MRASSTRSLAGLLVGVALTAAAGQTWAATRAAQEPPGEGKLATPIKAGIIGLDAHALPWTKIINAPGASGELADMTVVVGYPGGSSDIPQSLELREKSVGPVAELGVEIVASIDALLEKVDVVMILSIDGRMHLEQAKPVFAAGKPVFIDKPIAQLIKDLDESGHLDRTLIILASEFSRDAIMEGRPGEQVKNQVNQPDIIEEEKFYGMHRHFTDGSSVLMWGGGVEKGLVYGKTADERPCSSIENPVVIDQVHQSIYHALGMHPETHYTIEGRPFYTTPDGQGKPILDLFGKAIDNQRS